MSPHAPNDVQSMLDSWIQDWRNVAADHVATGTLDAERAETLVDRARQGAAEGVVAGTGDRPWRTFSPRPSTVFSCYR